jgi:hypothetical protein
MNAREEITTIIPDKQRDLSISNLQRPKSSSSKNSHVDRTLQLQRAIGNQAVQSLFESGVIQAKLNVGAPDDIYEQEGDRVAEQVMRMPEPALQTKPLTRHGLYIQRYTGNTASLQLTESDFLSMSAQTVETAGLSETIRIQRKEGETAKPAGSQPIKKLHPKLTKDVIPRIIELFSKSRASQTKTGKAVLAKMKELHKEDEIGLEDLPPGMGGLHRPGILSWGEYDIALDENSALFQIATKIVHETVHSLEIERHVLDDELAAFTFEAEYFSELKAKPPADVVFPKGSSLDDFLRLQAQNKAIDFLFPNYTEKLDVDWIKANIDNWGGLENREPLTKGAYLHVLLEDGGHRELIRKILNAPVKSPFDLRMMMQDAGNGDIDRGLYLLEKELGGDDHALFIIKQQLAPRKKR